MNGEATMTNGLVKELQQRHVLRIAGLYLLMSVPIMEAGDIILPRLGFPDGSLTVVLGVLAAGFPVALILAWMFEITPEGVKVESDVVRTADAPRSNGRTVDFVIIGLLLIALAWLSWDKFLRDDPSVGAAVAMPSIAVLPFVNMSNDEANEYFSDGMSEELLNALAKVPNLRVAGRTSSFYYKGRNEDLRSIGRNLGVDNVLEGSVRKDGDRVRVTTQLISVSNGFHLWSETYDYTLEDVFAVQDQIARSVVDVLKVRLLGEEKPAVSAPPTSSTVAHSSYLRGRYELHRRTEESIIRSTAFFREAVEADPQYAAAWVGLAESQILQFVNFRSLTEDTAIAGAQQALDKALALDSHSAEAYAALGLLRMQTHDNDKAKAAFEKAIQINPEYPEAWHWYGLLDGNMGEYDSGLEKLRRSVELDPLHRVARSNLGQAIMMSGDWDGARAFFRRGIELEPDYPLGYVLLAGIESQKPWPEPRAALQLVNQALQYEPDSLEALGMKFGLELELAMPQEAAATVERMTALRPGHPKSIESRIALLVANGDMAGAAAFVNQAVDQYGDDLGHQKAMFTAISALLIDDAVAAADALTAGMPDLFEPEPRIGKERLAIAPLIAHTLLMAGRRNEAEAIVRALDTSIETRGRFGPMGYNLLDAQVAAMRGQNDLAVERLLSAFESGYRVRLVLGTWTLETYPVFAGLRDDPRFQDVARRLGDYHEQAARAPLD